MSGAGRGTSRVSPFGVSPVQVTPSSWMVSEELTELPWHMELDFPTPVTLLLTANYVEYVINSPLPRGAVRAALVGTYEQGAAGGFPGMELRWATGTVATRARVHTVSDTTNAVFGPAADTSAVEVPAYARAVTLPPSSVAGAQPFICPIWVPPVSWGTTQLTSIVFDLFVREASGLTPGQLTITRIIAENFGQPQPVAGI